MVVDGWAFIGLGIGMVWACMRMGLMVFMSGRWGLAIVGGVGVISF